MHLRPKRGDVGDMADCVTNYVAERIVERERAMEGDWLLRRFKREDSEPRKSAGRLIEAATSGQERSNLGWVVAAFLFGIILCAAILFGWAWLRVG